MKKITLTTIKSFIKKNKENIHIQCKSDFDGMVDCVMPTKDRTFKKADLTASNYDNTFGIVGAWFVKSSRDYFNVYEDENFSGFEISNCCGKFVLAVSNKKGN